MPSHKAIMQNLDRAVGISHCSDFKKARLGCVIVAGNKVISTGFNQLKTSPIQQKYNKYRPKFPDHIHNDTLHAEVDALNKCSFLDTSWDDVCLYVGRADRANNPKMAKPCPACIQAIKERGIKKVYYTTEDGYGFIKL